MPFESSNKTAVLIELSFPSMPRVSALKSFLSYMLLGSVAFV
jgi:hypothetical protein